MSEEAFFSTGKSSSNVPPEELESLQARIADLEAENERLRAANHELQDNTARLSRVLEGADEGFWEWDLTTQKFVVSERFESMLGFTLGERDLSPDKWGDYVHPEDLARARESIALHLAGLRPNHELELRCLTRSGEYKYILTRGRVVSRNPDGVPTLMAGTHTDIQERKKTEAALRDSEALFKGLTETQPGLVFVTDRAGGNTYVNSNSVAYTGHPQEDLLGEGWLRVIHPDDVNRLADAWKMAVTSGGEYQVQFRCRRHDGAYRWFLCVAKPVSNPESGCIDSWVGISIDIHDQKMAEAEIQRLNLELEQRMVERTAELTKANQELEGFTFATSHDLKGPLGRINAFSLLLEEKYGDRLEGEALTLLNFIRQNAVRVNKLVDDLLDHAQVSQQKLELQQLSLGAVVRNILHENSVEIAAAGARVKVDLPQVNIVGDLYALEQALRNLLCNALKYSAPGRTPIVEIGGEPHGDYFRVWIRDNGIGFDMGYHDKIFEIFRRLHTYTEYQGNGIGLALVKQAVTRMGGKVWAESSPGEGAVFFLELQVAPNTGGS